MDDETDFVRKHSDQVAGVLSCFDRLIFKGYLPFRCESQMHGFVDYTLKMKRKDFLPFAERQAQRLVDQAQATAEAEGVEYRYLQGKHAKDKLAEEAMRRLGGRDGLVLVLCVQETCSTFKLMQGKGRPRLAPTRRPQRVLYFYYNDAEFGLMHVRIQTWFPLTVQVYVNGHEWLARQLLACRSGFIQRDNCFLQLDDAALAQVLADKFAHLDWVQQLTDWARRVNPLLDEEWLQGQSYYWVVDQAEYSTDVLFTSPETLGEVYSRLLDHAALHFSARDVLRFLGRRLHPLFEGEVLTDCKRDRAPGSRIKHRVKDNWLKMYDKFGQVLRVETVINSSREFKVRRCRERQGVTEMAWQPMNKGVSNLYHYAEVSRAANGRYFDALAVVDNPAAAYRQVEQLVERKVVHDRSHAGFNPARRETVRLFQAVLDGNHLLRGFRNADLRRLLYAETSDRHERRRQATTLSRSLKRLHVRGLIAKIPRTYRWNVTRTGRQLLGTILQLFHHGIPHAA